VVDAVADEVDERVAEHVDDGAVELGVLARELEVCYGNISLITDYDVGVEGDPAIAPVTAQDVLVRFRENTARLRELILRMVAAIPASRDCPCAVALAHARVG